jgi:AraC-like DNA-binding protein
MTHHKPYTNPNLTIHELASSLKMTPHLLSRVINEGFGKNFFDFVNQYRVDELKHRMNDPHARHQTLLSMAFDVGFNSKTAFNRAFKKLTQQTPKEYFQTPTEEHAD